MICFCGLFAWFCLQEGEDGSPQVKFGVLCVAAALFFLAVAVFVPNEKTLYKMAGVTDQQKSSIDANGKVLEKFIRLRKE